MTYHCKDCSYRGGKIGSNGECPACGSFDISRTRAGGEAAASPKQWRLILVVALWATLIVLVTRKFVS